MSVISQGWRTHRSKKWRLGSGKTWSLNVLGCARSSYMKRRARAVFTAGDKRPTIGTQVGTYLRGVRRSWRVDSTDGLEIRPYLISASARGRYRFRLLPYAGRSSGWLFPPPFARAAAGDAYLAGNPLERC